MTTKKWPLNRRFSAMIAFPICMLILIVAFQNCKKGGGTIVPGVSKGTPSIVPGSTTTTTTTTTILSLTIVAKEDPSVNPTATPQNHFPVDTNVEFELLPSTHPLVKDTTTFSWLISTRDFWSSIASCQSTADCRIDPEDGSCSSSHTSCTYELPDVHQPIDTTESKATHTFSSEIGVYDILGGKQFASEQIVQTITSLVIGKCESDFAIQQQSAEQSTTTTAPSTSLPSSSISSSVESTDDHITTFVLNLNEELLDPSTLELSIDDMVYSARLKWRILFEMILESGDSVYAIWMGGERFGAGVQTQYENSHTWSINWNTDIFLENLPSTGTPISTEESSISHIASSVSTDVGMRFSGKVMIEAFAEDLNQECIHADQIELTLPQAVTDALSSKLSSTTNGSDEPSSTPEATPELIPTPTTSPTTTLTPPTTTTPVGTSTSTTSTTTTS